MDEITLDGKVYISSKRAAKSTGYAKDYVGQLCREGRVEARLVGRSWYVLESSIMNHRFSTDKEGESTEESEDFILSMEQKPELESEKTNVEAILQNPVYMQEPELTMAISEPVSIERVLEKDQVSHIDDMQSAWKDWFATKVQAPESEELMPVNPEPAPEVEEDRTVPEVTPAHEADNDTYEEREEPVAIHRTVEVEPAPVHRAQGFQTPPYEAPVARPVEMTRHVQAEALIRQEERVSSTRIAHTKSQKQRRGGGRGVFSVLLLALMLLSGIIAFFGSGASSNFFGKSNEGNVFLQFISGEETVENNVK